MAKNGESYMGNVKQGQENDGMNARVYGYERSGRMTVDITSNKKNIGLLHFLWWLYSVHACITTWQNLPAILLHALDERVDKSKEVYDFI